MTPAVVARDAPFGEGPVGWGRGRLVGREIPTTMLN